ncbi:HET-domain-containing protein [Leucogyrophana mollusca]|uniref:HET-domain-containing protein n=1 Tax=Leucogyrophana mollusca TaxID=85980 RepID=A0ACB8BPN9_9AGAM|nr:HET-domain-containing protein [Leucogyrophana mollusca]
MRLLNTNTLKLEEPRGKTRYAILSHVWGDEEASFREINEPHAVNLKGYSKIQYCCAQALEDGLEYAWIDTCCIDKSSSTELSEAINSMYRWYEEAFVCYVYLEDVRSDADPAVEGSQFWRSKWFTRGWTLQELIAPGSVIFFAKDWVEIGSRESLIPAIARITGVDERVLLGTLRLAEVSVAKKMAWASRRETTRVEDRAYSLMGIFRVHMPLIYGEGAHAFTRLQHEIMRTSNDQSIFAWSSSTYDGTESDSLILAPSPDCFYFSASIDRIPPEDFARLFGPTFQDTEYKSHFSMTNSGIQISLPVKIQPTRNGSESSYVAVLAYSDGEGLVGLTLLHRGGSLFQRQQSPRSHIIKVSTPYDEFLARDVFISTEPLVRGYSLPVLPELGHPAITYSLRSVHVQAAQLAHEGFLLRGHRLGQNLRTIEGSGFVWNPAEAGARCSFAYLNPTSGEGFVVTVGGWFGRPCVHIDDYRHGNRIEDVLSPYGRDDSPCCSTHPAWAFKPLRAGKRVTVATRYQGVPHQWVVSVSVGYPRSAGVHRGTKRLPSPHPRDPGPRAKRARPDEMAQISDILQQFLGGS